MTPTTRATCILALEHRLDVLRLDLAARRFDWFVNDGSWRADIHRRALAFDIRAIRNALRELRVRSSSREQTWEQLRALGYDELELRAMSGDR